MNEKKNNMFILYEVEYFNKTLGNNIINRLKKIVEDSNFLGVYQGIDNNQNYYFGFFLLASQPILYDRIRIFDGGDYKTKKSNITLNGFGIQDSFYNRPDWSELSFATIDPVVDIYSFDEYRKSVLMTLNSSPNKFFINSYIEYRKSRNKIPINLITENSLTELIKYT